MSAATCQQCGCVQQSNRKTCRRCGRSFAGPPCYASGVEAEVCADIAARQRKGVAKYGTTVEANPLSLEQWLTHAYEECLDQAIYLKKAIAVTKTQNDQAKTRPDL